jgi:small subunit ribosomal protein S20
VAEKQVAKVRTPKEVKRNRQSLAANERNRSRRTRMRNQVKALRTAIAGGDVAQSAEQLNATVSVLHKMARQGIIHRRNAARQISRLSKHVSKLKK